jgi:male germ cell-associated kinase
MDKYSTVKVIGDGTYGSVIKAMNRRTGEIVAIKKMKKKYYKWSSCVDQKEVESLIKLSHPCIVKLYEIILENGTLHFVFEYLDQNVYEIMKSRNKLFPEAQIRNILF